MSWLNDFKSRIGEVGIAESFGGSTSQFDITKVGDDVTYSYDGTGQSPDFLNLQNGITIDIKAQNFSSVNNVRNAVVKSFNYNSFTIENSSGTAEDNKTVGTGFIKVIRQNFLDSQYIQWANMAINSINKVANGPFALITTSSEITDLDILEIVNEYVSWKWNESMGAKVAGGFMYRDGINTVDKKGVAKQYQEQAIQHKKNYEQELSDYASDNNDDVGVYFGTFIRS